MADGRRRILDAARTLFGRHGFDRTTVRDIAEVADVDKALVFYHFDTKEELFTTILQEYFDAHHDALHHAWQASGSLRERLHRVVDAYVDFIVEHHAWPRLIQQISSTRHSTFFPVVQQGFVPVIRWAEAALAEVTDDSGPRSAYHVYQTMAGAIVHHFTHAPIFAAIWDETPFSSHHLEERRAHLHWLVDTLLDALQTPQ